MLQRKISEYERKWVPDLKRSDLFGGPGIRKRNTFSDILQLAMKREEKSLKLYNELAGKTEKGSLAKVFQMLAQEEAKHNIKLETSYDAHMAKLGDESVR